MKEKHSSHRKAKGNDKINCVREKRNEMEKKRREEKRREEKIIRVLRARKGVYNCILSLTLGHET